MTKMVKRQVIKRKIIIIKIKENEMKYRLVLNEMKKKQKNIIRNYEKLTH
jgi:hypothetical protein